MAKHGVSLGASKYLDWNHALVWADCRRDYGEARQVALAPLAGRLHCVVFVDHADVRRVISLRKANQREFDYYEKDANQAD